MVALPKGKFVLPYHTMTSKIQPCFFFEPREKLFTGEETALGLLLNGISLNSDIQDHINGFIGEEPEKPYLWQEDNAYVFCHDSLHNKYAFPIDKDEVHYFDTEFEDDFVVDEIIHD